MDNCSIHQIVCHRNNRIDRNDVHFERVKFVADLIHKDIKRTFAPRIPFDQSTIEDIHNRLDEIERKLKIGKNKDFKNGDWPDSLDGFRSSGYYWGFYCDSNR